MKSLIIKTKFLPPIFRKSRWEKVRLYERYKLISDHPLTVVKAGPGYGKSTTLASYFNKYHPDDSYWYSIDELDADPALFLLNFIHAFKYHHEDMGEEAIDMLSSTGNNPLNLNNVVDVFINELLERLEEESYLILDDFNLVNHNQRILDTLSHFIKMIPPDLHLIIASRERVEFREWASWRLKKQVLLISEGDFALDAGEIRDFFAEQYEVFLGREDASLIQQETEGWIMALDLIGQGLKNKTHLEEMFSTGTGSLELLFEYLAFEILENQSPLIRDFLLQTAVLKYLRPEICNELLEIDNSREILENLSNRGIFVYSLGEEQYRYHHLFHEFLRKQGVDKYPYIELHKRAAEICLEEGERGFAIYHSLGAGEYEQAARLIISSADKLLELGRVDTLQSAMDELPEDLFFNYPLLYIYQGDIYRLRSEFNQALNSYKKARLLFQQNREKLNLSRALRKIALVYLDTVQPAKADQYLKEALRLIDVENLWEESTLLTLMAENKANEGHLDEAIELQEKADAISTNEMFDNNIRARVFLRTGRLDAAQQTLEEKVNREEGEERIPRSHRETILILSLIHSFKGEPGPALEYARGGVYLGRQLHSPFIRAVAYMRLGHAYQLSGRNKIEEARNAYFRALEIVDELKIVRGRAEPLMGLAFLEGNYGNPELGSKYGREGLEISNQSGDEWLAGLVKHALGINCFYAGELAQAEEYFLGSTDIFIGSKDIFGQAASRLWLVLIYYQQKKWNRFEEVTGDLFTGTVKDRYQFLFLKPSFLGVRDVNRFVPPLLKARDREIEVEYISGLLAELGLTGVDNHPGYSLRIRGFGNLRVWRGEEEIGNREWQREKARELFIFFLIHRGEYIPREKIFFLLWPEDDEESAARNFKVALNALKKALEPERKPRQSPFFIKRRDSNYGLNDSIGYNYDVEEFEGLIRAGEKEGDIKSRMDYYQSAVELYQGDFLLDNLYLDWLRNERERLRNIFLNAADKLARYYYQQGEYEKSLKISGQLLKIDLCWEPAYLYQMKSYYRLNQRSLAIKTYHKCKQVMDRELNIIPMAEIEAFYRRITS